MASTRRNPSRPDQSVLILRDEDHAYGVAEGHITSEQAQQRPLIGVVTIPMEVLAKPERITRRKRAKKMKSAHTFAGMSYAGYEAFAASYPPPQEWFGEDTRNLRAPSK